MALPLLLQIFPARIMLTQVAQGRSTMQIQWAICLQATITLAQWRARSDFLLRIMLAVPMTLKIYQEYFGEINKCQN